MQVVLQAGLCCVQSHAGCGWAAAGPARTRSQPCWQGSLAQRAPPPPLPLFLGSLLQEEKAAKGAADFASAMQGGDKSAIVGSLRDMLYKKRMERQLLAAKGLIAAPERPPDEVGRRRRGAEGLSCGWTQPGRPRCCCGCLRC